MTKTSEVQWLGRLTPKGFSEMRLTSGKKSVRNAKPKLPENTLRVAWQLISILLTYPDDRMRALLPLVLESAKTLPAKIETPITRLTNYILLGDATQIQSEFIDTFDTTRKRALHLTFHTDGDTRKRGVSIVEFKLAYRKAGMEINDSELPDHLTVVLEFGAMSDYLSAWKLLNKYRVGIEIVQLGLDSKKSPWADAILALRETLPPIDGSVEDAVKKLLAEGPPSEGVGLDGYSAIDPALNPHPAENQIFSHFDCQGDTQ